MDLKLGPDHDLTPDVETVSGVEAFPQKVMTCLSSRKGEWFLDREFGSRLAEYCTLFSGSPWLPNLLKLEVIRLATIPHKDEVTGGMHLALECVETVKAFELLEAPRIGEWNRARVEFDVKGLGNWSRTLEVLLPGEREEPGFPDADDAATLLF